MSRPASVRPTMSALTALAVTAGLALTASPLVGQQSDSDGNTARNGRPAPRTHTARPRVGEVLLDGVLDDPAWADAVPISGFVQGEPVEGKPAEHDTEVRVLFDEDAVWVALRMHDLEPQRIARQLYRRDDRGQADYVEIGFDPNLDRRTAYVFTVSAANVQADKYLYDDEHEDRAWDAVWASAVSIDEGGWSAELRIPLSQMRYEAAEGPQRWGFDVHRSRVASKEETYLALISQLRQGKVSQFALLDGIRAPSTSRRIEALPYVVSSLHNGPVDAGDPFFDGTATSSRMGVDLSYGVGAAFTLDATINPDFGQVEADPAVINLSAYETFFQERRPFFVEDARVFDFNLSGGRNQLFYSRRVGRRPHGGAPDDALFSDVPDNATILGAAKLAGRTSSGLSIGVLAAVTGTERGRAIFEDGGEVTKFLVEPRTEYGVLSLQQDFRDGATTVGGIATALRRGLPDDGSFDDLPSQAFNGGVRFEHQWNDREWALFGFLAGSHVRGSEAAIAEIQTASNHYFQRPDATRFRLDPTKTSISGAEWRLQFERRSGLHWTGSVWLAEVTKGFEINDLGFSGSAERLDGGFRFGYREINPGSVFRSYNVSFTNYHNVSHEALDAAGSWSAWQSAYLRGTFNLNAEGQLLNYWNGHLAFSYSPDGWSRSSTRGGPIIKDPGSLAVNGRFNTDRRQPVSLGGGVEWRSQNDDAGGQLQLSGDVRLRPSSRLEITVQPRVEWQSAADQYVTASDALPYEPTYGTRYLFADLERTTVSMETRLDWTFSPTLTLQLFAQPLLSSGDFVTYKQLARARSFDFRAFEPGVAMEGPMGITCGGGDICRLGDDQHVDFDQDGVADFSFSERDFNVRSLVGNAVLRWEYRPGSTVFLVWQRRQAGSVALGDFDFGRDLGALWNAPSDDRFIVKVNYWLGL
jgi:hypothetical protein